MKAVDLLNGVLPDGRYALKSATYGQQPRQKLDVYVPNEKKRGAPPVVFVYGGAWREGERDEYEFVGHALSREGYTVIIPDYRLYPAVQYPAFVDDVAQAIAYVEREADSLLGEPFTDYVLMGHSSGAHTAALLATRPSHLQQQGVQAQLRGLIGMAGPYDLPLDLAEVAAVFGDVKPEAVKPVLDIPATMPPSLLLHGADDGRVLLLHTRRFEKILIAANKSVERHIYPGTDHVRLVAGLAVPLHFFNDSYDDVTAFLAQLPPAN